MKEGEGGEVSIWADLVVVVVVVVAGRWSVVRGW